RLLKNADVLIENFRRGTMEQMGFGYQAVHAANPRLVYCSISGFGRTGPYADRGGFDLVAQGMSGLMSITGEGPGRPPVKVGAPVADITAGILACTGVLAALQHRHRTGEGQMVDTSLFEAAIVHTYWQSAIALASGIAPGPMLDVLQMHANEQTRARDMIVEVEHAALGKVKTIGLPVKFSASPGGPKRGAPVYGEHTREVLREHGFAEAEIDAMAKAGVI